MTFKHAITLPADGGHKLRRFKEWAKQHLPDLDYSLPPQTPIEATTLTIRLRTPGDAARVRDAFTGPLP